MFEELPWESMHVLIQSSMQETYIAVVRSILLRIFFCLKCRLSGPRYKANLLMHVWGTPLRAYVLIKLFIRRFVSWRHISVMSSTKWLHLLRASKRIPSKCVADVFSWNRRAGLSCLSLHLLVVECCPWSLHKVKFPITYLNVMH